jgi:hypothetical protein
VKAADGYRIFEPQLPNSYQGAKIKFLGAGGVRIKNQLKANDYAGFEGSTECRRISMGVDERGILSHLTPRQQTKAVER